MRELLGKFAKRPQPKHVASRSTPATFAEQKASPRCQPANTSKFRVASRSQRLCYRLCAGNWAIAEAGDRVRRNPVTSPAIEDGIAPSSTTPMPDMRLISLRPMHPTS